MGSVVLGRPPGIVEGIKASDAIGVGSFLSWKGSPSFPSPLLSDANHIEPARFLHRIRTETSDKIVLISNYTQTLDLFEKLCRAKK